MPSQLQRKSAVLVSLEVDVSSERVQQGLEAAYTRLQRTARVKGFRPGKVPRGVLRQLLGKSVRQELAAELVQEGLGKAFEEHGLEPVAITNVAPPTLTEGEPLRFAADVEVRPSIASVDTSALEVVQVTETVSDADVEREIERLRAENAELVTPEPPRPARAGDVVTFDMTVRIGDEERPDLAMKDSRTELGSERLVEPIEKALTGLEVGASREAEIAFAADHENQELRGRTAVCSVLLKALHEQHLPDLDDDFAKDLEHESLDALRVDLRRRLQESANERAQARLREQVIDRLLERNPIEVPPTLVQRQAQQMLAEIVQLQRMLGSAMPEVGDLREEIGRRAERKVRAGLLLGTLAGTEKIEVGSAEVEQKLQEIADRTGKHVAKVRADHAGERLDALRNQLLEAKLLELLLSRATIKHEKEKDT